MNNWRIVLSWKVSIQEGDKVRPISKSFGCSFDESGAVGHMQNSEQKYLYVNWIIESDGNLVYYCWWERRTEHTAAAGDNFLESDLEPYYE